MARKHGVNLKLMQNKEQHNRSCSSGEHHQVVFSSLSPSLKSGMQPKNCHSPVEIFDIFALFVNMCKRQLSELADLCIFLF